jgi:hypothetical protein
VSQIPSCSCLSTLPGAVMAGLGPQEALLLVVIITVGLVVPAILFGGRA